MTGDANVRPPSPLGRAWRWLVIRLWPRSEQARFAIWAVLYQYGEVSLPDIIDKTGLDWADAILILDRWRDVGLVTKRVPRATYVALWSIPATDVHVQQPDPLTPPLPPEGPHV